ncbi:unnamed protein product, partial [Brassica oleracea var. botrytis]
IERRQRDRATATRSSDGDAIERRDRATATRSSVFSLTKQTRSRLETSKCRILSKNHKL